jgi:hypothetical protein
VLRFYVCSSAAAVDAAEEAVKRGKLTSEEVCHLRIDLSKSMGLSIPPTIYGSKNSKFACRLKNVVFAYRTRSTCKPTVGITSTFTALLAGAERSTVAPIVEVS